VVLKRGQSQESDSALHCPRMPPKQSLTTLALLLGHHLKFSFHFHAKFLTHSYLYVRTCHSESNSPIKLRNGLTSSSCTTNGRINMNIDASYEPVSIQRSRMPQLQKSQFLVDGPGPATPIGIETNVLFSRLKSRIVD
jgi:hypothetical protein